MADIIKKVKVMQPGGTFTDYIPLGADAVDVRTEDGMSVENKLKKKPYYFDTVADMKAATYLVAGDMAVTLGYYSINDGGSAEYNIIDDNGYEDNYYEELNNELLAELIIKDNNINIRQIGAKSNEEFDNYLIFYNIINFASNKKLNIYIPSGTYLISNTLNINNTINIIGENENNTILKITSNNDFIKITSSYTTMEKLKITTTDNEYNSSLITLSTQGHCWRQIIKHCIIDGISKLGNGIKIYPKDSKGLMSDLIESVTFINLYNGIFMCAENSQSWANGGIIKDCWQHYCVYGLNFDNSAVAFGG